MNDQSPHLVDETTIKWLENPNLFPYVREKFELLPLRARFPLRRYQNDKFFKLLGYSEISATAKWINDGFYRRIWFLMVPRDPYAKDFPGEAVKPSSIKPRKVSEWGRE